LEHRDCSETSTISSRPQMQTPTLSSDFEACGRRSSRSEVCSSEAPSTRSSPRTAQSWSRSLQRDRCLLAPFAMSMPSQIQQSVRGPSPFASFTESLAPRPAVQGLSRSCAASPNSAPTSHSRTGPCVPSSNAASTTTCPRPVCGRPRSGSHTTPPSPAVTLKTCTGSRVPQKPSLNPKLQHIQFLQSSHLECFIQVSALLLSPAQVGALNEDGNWIRWSIFLTFHRLITGIPRLSPSLRHQWTFLNKSPASFCRRAPNQQRPAYYREQRLSR
jgi:hypothetical protein